MTLGDRLQNLRKEKVWTQQGLADELGVHRRQLSRYENDVVRPPKKTMRRLAEILHITVEELLEQDARENLTRLIPDPELLQQFQEAALLEEEDRMAVKRILAALIMKRKMQEVTQELGPRSRAS